MSEEIICGCPRDCPRHGHCEECRARHQKSIYKVYCERKKAKNSDTKEASRKRKRGRNRNREK